MLGGGTNGVYASLIYESPGCSAVFTIYITRLAEASPAYDVHVEHKNREEETWHVEGFPPLDMTGIFSIQITDLREEYRWSLTIRQGAHAWVSLPILSVWPVNDAYENGVAKKRFQI